MFSLSDLPEYGVLDELKAIERDLLEMKTAQRVGPASLLIKYTRTAAAWDVDETLAGSLTFVRWRVTFTPDHGGTPYARLGFNYQLTPASAFSSFVAYPDPASIAGGPIAFLIAFTNNEFNINTRNVKLKFGIKSVDSGTLSVARVFQV